jgi:hypothetical protein
MLGLADDADERADQLGFALVDGIRRRHQPFHALGDGLVLMLRIGGMRVLDGGIDDGGIGFHEMGRLSSIGDTSGEKLVPGGTSAAPPIQGK